MTAAVIELRQPATRKEARYVCSKCGDERTCNCNAPAIEKAAAALKANPTKSDRAIAAEIGVSHPTVAKARKATGKDLPVERTGLDGKTRKVPAKADPVAEGEVMKAKHAAAEEPDEPTAPPEPESADEHDDGIRQMTHEELLEAWAAARARIRELEARNQVLSAALDAKLEAQSFDWPADMWPGQVKKRNKYLAAIASWQRELEALHSAVTGTPSWRVEIVTKDGTQLCNGARLGTRGEAEKYATQLARSDQLGLGDDYASAEVIPCQDKPNVSIEGENIRFEHGGCLLLKWHPVETKCPAELTPSQDSR